MRFAGTWIMYSKKAIPQLTIAATYHGLAWKLRRCPYHAKVMKRFEAARRTAVAARACSGVIGPPESTREKPCILASGSGRSSSAGASRKGEGAAGAFGRACKLILPRQRRRPRAARPVQTMVPHLTTSLSGPLQELE